MAISINWELPITFVTYTQIADTKQTLKCRVTINWYDILGIQEYMYDDILPVCVGNATIMTTTGFYVTSENFDRLVRAWTKYKQYVYDKSHFINLSTKNN